MHMHINMHMHMHMGLYFSFLQQYLPLDSTCGPTQHVHQHRSFPEQSLVQNQSVGWLWSAAKQSSKPFLPLGIALEYDKSCQDLKLTPRKIQ